MNTSEIVDIGSRRYEQDIRPKVEAANYGRIVAIDVMTGEYEIAASMSAASDGLKARCPSAIVYFARVGHRGVVKLGFRSTYGVLKPHKAGGEQ